METQKYKVILSYDILNVESDAYYRFMLGKFVPALQDFGCSEFEAWHTAYGDYPVRLVTFVADSYDAVQDLFATRNWEKLEEKLHEFVTNYNLRIVPVDGQFYF